MYNMNKELIDVKLALLQIGDVMNIIYIRILGIIGVTSKAKVVKIQEDCIFSRDIGTGLYIKFYKDDVFLENNILTSFYKLRSDGNFSTDYISHIPETFYMEDVYW